MNTKLLLAIFDDDQPLLEACRKLQSNGIDIHDTYSPYAIHGLEKAAGMPRTRLAQVCFALGSLGLTVALGFQLWTSVIDWPINIGGKTNAAFPALIPVAFELTVLFAAVGTVITFFIIAQLWPGQNAILPIEGICDNRFAVAVNCNNCDETQARKIFEQLNTIDIREVEISS